MPEIRVEIKNINQIRSAFKQAPVLMANNLNKAIRRSLLTVQAKSMRNSPVATGRLRASHSSRFSPLRGELEPTAFYAFWVHDGTKYMKARPFLLNAVESSERTVDDNFERAVQDTLDTIGAKT